MSSTAKPESIGRIADPKLLEAVITTAELRRRPPRSPDYAKENRALVALMQEMTNSPKTILQKLVETAMDLCRAGSGGISLLSSDGASFYWPAVAGSWQPYIGGGTPRDFGPCGIVLDRNATQLFSRPERYYPYLEPVIPAIEEVLLIPFYVGGKAVGTIWVVAHDKSRHFDREDERILRVLGEFAASAYQTLNSLEVLRKTEDDGRRANAELAARVTEVQKVNAELEDARRAALNVMEDTLAARQQAEQTATALRESEERFRAIVETTPECVKLVAPDGALLHMNASGLAMVGTDCAESVVGRSVYDLIAPEDRDRFRAFNERICRGEKGSLEFDIVGLQGKRRHMETQAAPLRHSDGTVVQLAVTRDVTERKQAEESQARLAAIVESSDDAIVSKDLNGVITSWNKGAARLFGYTAQEVIGQPVTMLMPPERVDEEPLILERIRHGESIEHYETVRRRKDGKLLDISLTVSPVRDHQGRVIGASKIARDITGRKRAEEALRRAAEFDEAVMANMGEGLYTVDSEGLVTSVNPAAEKLFGWSFAEMRGRKMHDLTHHHHPDGRPFPAEECSGLQVLRQGKSLTDHEDVFIRKDGTFFNVIYSSAPLRSGSEITGLVVVFRDITEMKQAEAALRRTEKLAATGQLAATIAHEINNPMQALTNLLALLTYKASMDKDARAIAEMAQAEVGRMAHITKQMLSFHRDTLTPVPVRITEVLEDALELWTIKLKGQLRVERKYESTEHIADFPGELKQVFVNLIGNALEAAPEGSALRLHVFPSRDWRQMRAGVRVVVADRGSGIKPEHLKKIFEPFFTTKSEKGTGLGLWVSKQIVERHGGHVRVRTSTRAGRSGTVFSIFLPGRAIRLPTAITDSAAVA